MSHHIAICFFGLVKNIAHTQASLQTHIFDSLKAQGYTYELFAHTYNVSDFSNARNAEANLAVYPQSIQVLRGTTTPITVRYTDPLEVDQLYPVAQYLRNGDPWPENPQQSLKYFLRQLASLQAVTALWKRRNHCFNYVLYLRPDTLFLNSIIVNPTLANSEIITPSFHIF